MSKQEINTLRRESSRIDLASFYEVNISADIEGLTPGEIGRIKQLAYAVNPNNFTIIIDKSGHGKIVRGRNKHDYEGGWIFPRKGKITFYSGFLGEVRDKELVREVISQKIGVDLRSVDDSRS